MPSKITKLTGKQIRSVSKKNVKKINKKTCVLDLLIYKWIISNKLDVFLIHNYSNLYHIFNSNKILT